MVRGNKCASGLAVPASSHVVPTTSRKATNVHRMPRNVVRLMTEQYNPRLATNAEQIAHASTTNGADNTCRPPVNSPQPQINPRHHHACLVLSTLPSH